MISSGSTTGAQVLSSPRICCAWDAGVAFMALPNAAATVDAREAGYREALYAWDVPLTTLRQPTRQIGDAALRAMLERVARTDLPVRDILLHCDLVVRASCGADGRTGA